MNEGTHCPCCRKDIGLWAVFAARWPTRTKCPHCKSVLAYEIAVWRTLFTLALPLCISLSILAVAVARLIVGSFGDLSIGLALILFLGLWSVFEFLSALCMRRAKTLRIASE